MSLTKHYLWCVTLALCVGGSAYAGKGGHLGTRAMAQLRAATTGLQSKLLSKGELAHKLANSKLARTAAAGVLGITIACGGSGCGNDASLSETLTPTEEVMEVTDSYIGDSIYFKVGDTIYEGYVVEGVSENEVLVLLDDHSDMVISLDRIGGTRLADHPNRGVEVVLLGDPQKGESTVKGEIVTVYSDKVRKIEIFAASYLDGRVGMLDVHRIRFVPEDADIEEGGYLTIREFQKWLHEQME